MSHERPRPVVRSGAWPLRSPRALRAVLVACAALTLSGTALAQSGDRGVQPVAVQNRHHVQAHEFSGFVGTLPLDAFTKGLTVSASYTLHFDPLRAWEIVHAGYSFPVHTHLRADLDALDIAPTHFEVVELFVTSNFVYKPIYWKGAIHNRRLVHGEIFFVAGGGWGLLTRSGRPALDAGLGFRLFASDRVSVRFDARWMSFFTTSDLHNELWLGLGVSL
jgi:outer membrane beta-barrel protein